MESHPGNQQEASNIFLRHSLDTCCRVVTAFILLHICCSLFHLEDGGSTFIRTWDKRLPDFTASCPRVNIVLCFRSTCFSVVLPASFGTNPSSICFEINSFLFSFCFVMLFLQPSSHSLHCLLPQFVSSYKITFPSFPQGIPLTTRC